MNHRLSVVSVIVLLLAAPLAMASTTAPTSSTATTTKTTAATHAQAIKQKRIIHIQARIARLERLETILLSKSETLRLAKVARVKSQVRKLQARLTSLEGK
ncbi:hypothetical protein A4U49_15505 [Acidithiobacillus ferrivorans]|uniref:hypothetical protein n=1 Tax=Acidithiobacillus ferrivorans TaxID=160808 RepID=UPI000893D184|nr:hypothetical protein [Acidithiobacillus ferrivorans]OFA14983.1 hypothetical protein A4U49_15505 [Acidithiobacillus ferrivorans]